MFQTFIVLFLIEFNKEFLMICFWVKPGIIINSKKIVMLFFFDIDIVFISNAYVQYKSIIFYMK